MTERGDTITGTRLLYVEECPACHMLFGIPTAFEHQRRDDHATFFCPAGHAQSYRGQTEAQRLRGIVEWERAISEARSEMLANERRSHAATKGKLTKTRNRIAKGVCPCCNRQFVNVERHMTTQHPDYSGDTQ